MIEAADAQSAPAHPPEGRHSRACARRRPGRDDGRQFRLAARENRFDLPTTRSVAAGLVPCALVALPRVLAFDFLVFCQRNQRACPVYEVTAAGDPGPRRTAPGADPRRRDRQGRPARAP